jgi:hypothetical protein
MTFPGSLRGKVLEHIVDVLAELFNITVRIRGKILAVSAAPNQLLCMTVKDIHNDIADLRSLSGRRREAVSAEAAAAETSPSPPSSKTVIECVEGLLILRTAKCADRSLQNLFLVESAIRRLAVGSIPRPFLSAGMVVFCVTLDSLRFAGCRWFDICVDVKAQPEAGSSKPSRQRLVDPQHRSKSNTGRLLDTSGFTARGASYR